MSKDIEIEKIDKQELAKQMEDEILKGNYSELKILVGEGIKDPLCSFVNKNVTPKEVAIVYTSLGEIKRMIEEKYPLAVLFAKEYLEIKGRTDIDKNN